MIEATVPASPCRSSCPGPFHALGFCTTEPDRRGVNFQNFLSYCKRIGAKSATKEIYEHEVSRIYVGY